MYCYNENEDEDAKATHAKGASKEQKRMSVVKESHSGQDSKELGTGHHCLSCHFQRHLNSVSAALSAALVSGI
ncbi:hypothetical protein PISMIDRAFT_682398 [Pisolithus microcarpus 441]|uniref:Uncharacterized protein n=1 Tax=Pisolithus microcarpus 441 TaxID=765257 RepID=A0A0C9Y6J2_9AGAM|nr:hypothetical protein PISMIDRAFT_682398 [Pisolithus microcarpus 441]